MLQVSEAAAQATEQVADSFAPWVASLGLVMTDVTERQAKLVLPVNEAIQLRGGLAYLQHLWFSRFIVNVVSDAA